MPTNLTAIIVDNEPDAREGLELLINNEIPDVKVIDKAENAQVALEAVIDKHPDLLFLDIQMPEHDGFWLADKLKKMNTGTGIIFITAYDEYAIEAIKYAAFDFLTKPVDPVELKKSVERYRLDQSRYTLQQKLERLSTFFNRKKIRFNTQDGFVLIRPEEIVYCEAEGNYSYLYLTNGKKELITSQLGTLEDTLPKQPFLRINRSTTINLNFVDAFNRKTKMIFLTDILQKYQFKVSGSGAKRLMNI